MHANRITWIGTDSTLPSLSKVSSSRVEIVLKKSDSLFLNVQVVKYLLGHEATYQSMQALTIVVACQKSFAIQVCYHLLSIQTLYNDGITTEIDSKITLNRKSPQTGTRTQCLHGPHGVMLKSVKLLCVTNLLSN